MRHAFGDRFRIGQFHPLPRRWPHLPYKQCRGKGTARDCIVQTLVAVLRFRARRRGAPRRCTPSSSLPSSTASTRRPGSPMSSLESPSCRTPGCTNSCPGTGKPTGTRPWPRRTAPTSHCVFEPGEPSGAGLTPRGTRPILTEHLLAPHPRAAHDLPGSGRAALQAPASRGSADPSPWLRRSFRTPRRSRGDDAPGGE